MLRAIRVRQISILFLILLSAISFAQETSEDSSTHVYTETYEYFDTPDEENLLNNPNYIPDDSDTESRTLDTALVAKLRVMDDYNYDRIVINEDFSLLKRIGRFIERMLMKAFSRENKTAREFFAFVIVLAVAVLVFYLIFKDRINLVFYSSKKGAKPEAVVIEEDIHAIDFESEIQAAKSAGNLRLALRLLFLRSLKKLADSKVIDWRVNKTNRDFVSEIEDVRTKNDFGFLSNIFEYVWYGDFKLKPSFFNSTERKFTDFNQSIKPKIEPKD